jgi:heptosyltransferase-2
MIFECCELTFRGEDYDIQLSEEDRRFAREFVGRAGIGGEERVVGLNCGGGAAFANKMWGAAQCIEFVRRVRAHTGARVLLFGAARERETLRQIRTALHGEAVDTGARNTLKQFQALLGRCDVVVTGDSLGMHLALAEKRRLVVLFGPTCANEIELYGRGEKIVSPSACVPCYRRDCRRTPTCMEGITPDLVVAAVERQLKRMG